MSALIIGNGAPGLAQVIELGAPHFEVGPKAMEQDDGHAVSASAIRNAQTVDAQEFLRRCRSGAVSSASARGAHHEEHRADSVPSDSHIHGRTRLAGTLILRCRSRLWPIDQLVGR